MHKVTENEAIKIALEIQHLDLANKKLIADTITANKKNTWYELTIILAVVAVAVTLTKLFL